MRIAVLALLMLPAALAAQNTPRPLPTCDGPEFRAFDYWVGEWTVTDSTGKPMAESSISLLAKDCAVLEQWHPIGSPPGASISWYERTDSLWHQSWMSGTGRANQYVGKPEDGVMTMVAHASPTVWLKMTWVKRPGGVVRQSQFVSKDQGASWQLGFVGDYAPKR